jgi:lantibiotic modifying enzyme
MTAFLAAAERIARQLCRDAVWSGDRCNWLIWSSETGDDGSVQPLRRAAPPWLYQGTAGIALFLAHAARLTGDRHIARARDGAVRQMLARCQREPGDCSYFTGALGVGHSVATIAALADNSDLAGQGLDLVARAVGPEAGEASGIDVITGAAGAIPALIDLALRFDRPALLDAAARLAETLLARGQASEQGLSWPSADPTSRNLCGYSHGVSGFVAALAELNAVRPDPRYAAAVVAGLAYERHFLDPAQGNWPDFRTMPGQPPGPPSYPVAWCHGAVGIGLVRARLLALRQGDPALPPELDAAQRAASRYLAAQVKAPIVDFSPCHGLTGAADLLLLVGRQLGRPELCANAEAIGQFGIDALQTRRLPWPCGVPQAGESAGLMNGLAGIGLFFLRLHDQTVPSALMIRPGQSNQGS